MSYLSGSLIAGKISFIGEMERRFEPTSKKQPDSPEMQFGYAEHSYACSPVHSDTAFTLSCR